jgi:hypothetical protein
VVRLLARLRATAGPASTNPVTASGDSAVVATRERPAVARLIEQGEALRALGKEPAARERFMAAGRQFELEGRLKSAVDAWRVGMGEEVSIIS